jgi:ABC-type nitrate/sulfonate/bicarbonate transport system substrate-binding protein
LQLVEGELRLHSVRAVLIGICAFGMTNAYAAEPIKVRFGKLPLSITALRVTVADQLGLFKKNGIEIETTEFRASPELNTAVISGAIDIAQSGLSPVINAYQRNLPVKAFFIDADSPYYHLLSTPQIGSLQDAIAKGASVAVSGIGSTDHIVARYMIRRAGFDPDKLKYVQSGGPVQRVAALEAGRVDIAIGGVPESYAPLRNGKAKELAKMSDLTKHLAAQTLWAREDYIANNGPAIKAFLAALDEAGTWIKTSPDAPSTIAKMMGATDPQALEDVKSALAEISFPSVADLKAHPAEVLQANELLGNDAIERGIIKADSGIAVVQKLMDLRYLQ